MKSWEKFELECMNYLNKQFGRYATFIHQGGTDSSVSDILVRTNSGKQFYIDVKYLPAQCGQFVLLPNLKTCSFEYSKENMNEINDYTRMIIQHMNQNFNEFYKADTAGKEVKMENGSYIFSKWIIQTYKEKGVKFFITNNFTMIPIEKIEMYFEVSAKYRIKRSGSSSVGKNRITSVLNHIDSNDFVINRNRIDGSKLFVESESNLHNHRFIYQEYEYMFSKRDQEYEVRKLSNTYHANVIFSIKKMNQIQGISDKEFIQMLK